MFYSNSLYLKFSAGFYSFVYLVRLGKNAAGVGWSAAEPNCRAETPLLLSSKYQTPFL
jgi:hypothetical protein